ncbi:MAG: ABC transporter substrate-binding protein [Mycobacterium sp.]|nr:ABC transporter substrate-binding protein [Mycobacterium sp.]
MDLGASRAIDTRTAEIALSSPSFDLPTLLSSYGTRIVKAGTTDYSRLLGTGAFRFQNFAPGREFVATRFDDYRGEAAAIDELRVLSAGSEARLQRCAAGRRTSPIICRPLRSEPLDGVGDLSVHSAPDSVILYFAMKTDRPPFDNADAAARQLRCWVDREQLVNVALEGVGEVSA